MFREDPPMSTTMHDNEATLVLVCRRPATGVGKRRLAASLGDATTLAVAEALLAAALEDAAAWRGPVVIAPAAAGDSAWAAGLLSRPVDILPQPSGSLGQRLARLDHCLRQAGHRTLVYIGSDAPALAPEDYAATRRLLRQHDVVLAPAADGGVTLMASRLPWPALSGLPWETPALGAALHQACIAAGYTVACLPETFDVDTVADLARLAEALAADPRPARRALLMHVARHCAQPAPGKACG